MHHEKKSKTRSFRNSEKLTNKETNKKTLNNLIQPQKSGTGNTLLAVGCWMYMGLNYTLVSKAGQRLSEQFNAAVD